MNDPSPVLQFAIDISMVFLGLAALLALTRLVRGPSLPDRVVALDLIATVAVSVIAIFAIDVGDPILLRPAIVAALITFLGTVAFAQYVERRSSP